MVFQTPTARGQRSRAVFFLEETMSFMMFLGLLSLAAVPAITGAVGMAWMSAPAGDEAAKSFVGQSVTRTGTIHLNGPIARVFPLFEPIPEKLWAPGWEPKVVYP